MKVIFASFAMEYPSTISFLTGGFPCQPFSSAGKKQGIKDPRGTLFEAIIQVLRANSPRFFLLENVKRLLHMERGAHFATILSSLSELDYAIEWRLVNAMHFGLPQNRQRVLLTGVRCQKHPANPPAAIRLACEEDFRGLPASEIERIQDYSRWHDITVHGQSFPSWGLACKGKYVGCELSQFSDALPHVSLREVLENNVDPQFDFTETTRKWIHANTPVNKLVAGVEVLSNQRGGARMGYTIFGVNGVAPTLTSATSRHYERYFIGGRYRRLTNIEYARIQGFPDDHCKTESIYDQYSLYGNAVPPPLAIWAMDRLTNNRLVALPEPANLFAGTH